MIFVLAHASHWLISVVYAAPVLVVALVIGLDAWRQHKRRKNEPGTAS